MYPKAQLDLTLYLVTDSTPAILGSGDIFKVVEGALEGGVTIVQYRDKHADTKQMIDTAQRLHTLTQSYGVPLLINDRIDVALAAGVEGVHIGQDDMSVRQAREILPPASIIGVTASSIDEARKAILDGADYLGIGTMFGTPTYDWLQWLFSQMPDDTDMLGRKQDTKSIIGTKGTKEILQSCDTGTGCSIPCVAIGGINLSNVQRILHQTSCEYEKRDNALNGVAVVSAIMAARDPQQAASELKERIRSFPTKFYTSVAPGVSASCELPDILEQIPGIVKRHASSSVLCHNMTNTVVQNFAANVCLATGSSPIMSMNGEEASDLARLGGALVVNMGTATSDGIKTYQAGMKAYNMVGGPVLFDPVGGGATEVRKNAIKALLRAGFFDVIKGNEGEIMAVDGASNVQQRGVDSGPSSSTPEQKAELVKTLAQRERCIVLMSGSVDYLSDGTRTVAISNGSHWLGKITGSGCSLGAVIASYVAVHRKDKFIAVLAAILHYEIAAEIAEQSLGCRGPGTFIPAFLDALYQVRNDVSNNKEVPFGKLAKLEWK